MSGGREVLIPSRFLYGLVPDALLDAYNFWQDESVEPVEKDKNDLIDTTRGYKRLCGYPNVDDGEFLVYIEIIHHGSWATYKPESSVLNNSTVIQCTGFPGSTVRVTRRPKHLCEKDFQLRKRLAAVIETAGMMVAPKSKGGSEEEAATGEVRFKVDEMVECDHEGKGEFWACVVRRVNDNSTYDLEYINV
jgi:hypothetical protein